MTEIASVTITRILQLNQTTAAKWALTNMTTEDFELNRNFMFKSEYKENQIHLFRHFVLKIKTYILIRLLQQDSRGNNDLVLKSLLSVAICKKRLKKLGGF